jgi:ABC-type Na+ efflux pump permease subunit
MRFLLLSTRKDLLRIARDPLALIVWLLMPFLITAMLSLIFGRRDSLPQGRLLVVDEDKTVLSAMLPGMFNQGPLAKMVLIEAVDMAEGKKRVDNGDASALLVIPKGFGAAFLHRHPSELRLFTNPAQTILPKIIREALSMALEAAFYWQILFGPEVVHYGDGAATPAQIAQTAITVNSIVRGFSGYLDPLLVRLEIHTVEQQHKLNVGALFVPGMLFFGMLGLAQSISNDLWKERNNGTLRRLAISPPSLAYFLGGKMLSLAVVLTGVGSIALGCAIALLNYPAHNLLLAVIWVVGAGVGLFLFMAFIQVYAPAERPAHVITTFSLFLLSMLGGAFFPFEMMPDWLAQVGRLTPNGWAIGQLKQILSGAIGPAQFGLDLVGLLAVGTLAFLLVQRRIRIAFLS